MEVNAKKREVLAGMVIELSADEVSHMSVMLHDYQRLMKLHGNLSGGTSWAWVDRLSEAVDKARGALGLLALLVFCSTALHAQRVQLTNDDLHKRHAIVVPVNTAVLDGMREREYHAPPVWPPFARSASTGATTPSAGPWTFPEPRPARRLDGTLLSDPVQTYGNVPFYPFGFYGAPYIPSVERRSDR